MRFVIRDRRIKSVVLIASGDWEISEGDLAVISASLIALGEPKSDEKCFSKTKTTQKTRLQRSEYFLPATSCGICRCIPSITQVRKAWLIFAPLVRLCARAVVLCFNNSHGSRQRPACLETGSTVLRGQRPGRQRRGPGKDWTCLVTRSWLAKRTKVQEVHFVA